MRSLTTQERSALAAPHSVGAWLVEFGDWAGPGAAYRATTYGRTVKWGGYEWRGMGDLVAAEAIKTTVGFVVTQYRMTLPAVATDQIARALLPAKGTPVRIYDALIDPESGAVVPNPQLEDEAEIDRLQIRIRRDTSTVIAYIESENADFRRRRVRRWTDADHRARYPLDTGMRYVATIPQTALYFPTREAQL